MERGLQEVVDRLADGMDSRLQAAYLYPWKGANYLDVEAPDNSLLLVLASEGDIHQLRELFQSLWPAYQETLQQPPLVASRAAFMRHLRLNRPLAYHLATNGRQMVGARLLPKRVAPPHRVDQAASIALQTLNSSACLADGAQKRVAWAQPGGRLWRLAHSVTGQQPAPAAKATRLFAEIQKSLAERGEYSLEIGIADHGDDSCPRPIEAVYAETDHMVVVIPPEATTQMEDGDWQGLAEELLQPGMSMRVTTTAQLRLILRLESPLDVALARFQLQCGTDVLRGLQVTAQAVLRHAARIPSRLLVQAVPGAYLRAADADGIHKVIHDYQNRLLNLRLQHELLHRLHGVPAAEPTKPLPGREAPMPERVEAILDQLSWWAEHYWQAMQEVPRDQVFFAP